MFWQAIRSWLSDGCYNPQELKAALKLCFGETQTMFGNSHKQAVAQVGVTATLVTDSQPVLLINYNEGRLEENCSLACFNCGLLI